jgi:hypothetical protein
MKKIILSFLIFSALQSQAQLSIGGGAGIMDTSGAVVQLKVSYDFKHFGLTGGLISTTPGSGPCFFNLEAFAPINLSDHDRLTIHGGYAFKMVSADNKELNGSRWIAGINYEAGIFEGVNLYMGPSVINKRSFLFTIGIVGVFGPSKGCQ